MKNLSHNQIQSEIRIIKNYFGFSLRRMSELSEMNYTTFQNCYRDNNRNVFKPINLMRLKVNLHKLIKNYSFDGCG
jgi:hypothetical protein